MENNTRLPAGLVNGIYRILLNHSHAKRTAAAEEIAQYIVEEYATKLHQVEQENAELRRQNDKLKQQATGWRPLLEKLLVMNEMWGDLPGEYINEVKKFLYGE